MVQAEPVLPVRSAVRACGFSAQLSNRWEIEPPTDGPCPVLYCPLPAADGNVERVLNCEQENGSGFKRTSFSASTRVQQCFHEAVLFSWTPTVSSDEGMSTQALIRNTCASSH